MDATAEIAGHYTHGDLLAAVLAGLDAAGKEPPYSIDDLAPVDHFHMGGRPATEALIGLARFTPAMHLLDVGGGTGGPARMLATETGCRVTVLDLTPEFCRTGAELTRLTGLDHLVTIREGNALAMPFDDATFDGAWSQHSSMNIEDKEALYREIRRVLRPGGTFAFHEVMAGPRGGPLRLPVPWAQTPEISFLRPPDEIRPLLESTGFTKRVWEDVSDAALYWWRARVPGPRSKPAPPPPLGLHLFLGPAATEMAQNTIRNLEQDRIRVVRAVYTRR